MSGDKWGGLWQTLAKIERAELLNRERERAAADEQGADQ